MKKKATPLIFTKSVKTLLLMQLCILVINLKAQSPLYLFSQSSGTYVPITGGTVYSSGSSMDDASISYSLPFTYTFNGTPYTTGYANENGFITFGNTVLNTSTRRVISNAQTGFEAAAAFAQDLGGLNASSEMRGELLGTAPNRTFVVQWSNMVEYLGDFASFNFQIRINEGGGVAANQKVEFVYGNCTNTWADLSPQVGLRGVNNTMFINRTSSGTSWATNTAGTGNNDGCFFSSVTASIAPVNGLTFIWTRMFPVVTYTGSLSSFTSCSGTASAVQTLAVSGSSLAGNIGIVAPSGMEVSSTSSTSGFSSGVSLVRSGNSVAPTTLYFRISASASGNLSGNVTISNFGTSTQSIAVTGTANTLPVISASNATICAAQPYTIVPSGASTYTISGGTFTVSPSSTTSYSITGTSSLGCAGSNTFVCTITPTACVPGAALAFDGTDDYVLTNGFSNFTEYTIEGWFKLNSLVDQNMVVGTDIFSGPNAFYSNQIRLQGGKFVNYIYDGAAKTVSSSITPTTGVWYHVAVVGKNGSPLRINVNGTEDVSGSNVVTMQTGLSSYRLAGSAAGVLAPFNGYMDEVRIWNRALCAGEIINNANGEIATTGNGLVANYHFNQGNDGLNNSTVILLTDASGASSTGTLTNFALNGTTSNWVQPGAVISGSTVAAFVNPSVSVSGANVFCSGASAITLTASGLSSYTWASGPTTNTNAVTPTITTTYSVTGTNSLGCISTMAVKTVTANPAIILSTNIINVPCFGGSNGSATVSASGGKSPFTYLWSTASTSSAITGQISGAKTVTVTDANSCTITSTVTITQPTSAVSSATSASNILCNGGNNGSATITASGGIPPYTYQWSSSATASLITGQTAGVRTATITDNNNCTTTATVSITQPPTLTLTATSSSSSICSGNSGTLSASGTGGTGAITYTWVTGPTNSVNVVSPTVNSVYTVNSTDANNCAMSATVALNVLPLPTIAINNGTICVGQTFTISPSGANTYTVQGGSNTVSPGASTSYTVRGTSTAGCLSQNTATCNVTVNANPTISVNSGAICEGQTFTISPSGANTYTVQGGSTTVSPAANTSYTVAGTSTAGCISQTAISNITVNANPTISVNSGAICEGQTFTISPSGANAYTVQGGSTTVSPAANTSYTVAGTSTAGCISQTAISNVTVNANPTISVNSGAICEGQTFTISPSGANAYTVQGGSTTVSPAANTSYTVAGTSTAGCISQTAVSNVTVNANPTISVNSGAICEGQTFTISPSGANAYTVQGGSTTVSPAANTSYTVAGTSTSGCISQTAISNVTVNSGPILTANSSKSLICVGEEVTLTASGAITYTWSTSSLSVNVVVSPTVTSTYTVTGSDANGCTGIAITTQSVDACTGLTSNNRDNNERTSRIYPNPNNGEFIIEVQSPGKVMVTDMIGKIVFEGVLEIGENVIDLKAYNNGVYFVQIAGSSFTSNMRVVKN